MWRNRYKCRTAFIHYGEPTGPGEFLGKLDYPSKDDAEAAADDFLGWLPLVKGVDAEYLGAFEEQRELGE
jgi:hypothetical protein